MTGYAINETANLAEDIYDRIIEHLASSKKARVHFITMTRAMSYKHPEMIRVNGSKLQIQNGRSWNTVVESNMQLVGIRFV